MELINKDPIPKVNMMIFMKNLLNIGHSNALAIANAITMMIALYHGPIVKSALI